MVTYTGACCVDFFLSWRFTLYRSSTGKKNRFSGLFEHGKYPSAQLLPPLYFLLPPPLLRPPFPGRTICMTHRMLLFPGHCLGSAGKCFGDPSVHQKVPSARRACSQKVQLMEVCCSSNLWLNGVPVVLSQQLFLITDVEC